MPTWTFIPDRYAQHFQAPMAQSPHQTTTTYDAVRNAVVSKPVCVKAAWREAVDDYISGNETLPYWVFVLAALVILLISVAIAAVIVVVRRSIERRAETYRNEPLPVYDEEGLPPYSEVCEEDGGRSDESGTTKRDKSEQA